MLISIFPNAKAHPDKTKLSYHDKKGNPVYEKQAESQKCSTPNEPEVREIFTEDDLIDIVTNYAWSPSVFRRVRRMDNFIKADFMALDIDNGLTIEEAEVRIVKHGITALALPSPSHTPEAHRFRLIFPLAKSIYNKETFDATWEQLSEIFPELDKQCSDCCRFYFGSTMEEGFWYEADFLIPATPKPKQDRALINDTISSEEFNDKDMLTYLYGEIPESIPKAVNLFLANAESGLPDGWILPLNACCFTLALQGVHEEKIWIAIDSVAPYELDSRDIDTIEKAIKDGQDECT